MTGQLVAVLGRGVLERDEPIAYADDLGLTRGDGCFDATLVFAAEGDRRRVLHLDPHVARLGRSAAALELECPPAQDWNDLVAEAVSHPSAPPEECMLKLVLSRGREDHGGGVLGYLTVTPLPESSFDARRRGLHVASMDRGTAADAYAKAPWLLGGVKTIAYAINLAAKREAEQRGAHEALFVSADGYALEAPTAALIVRHGDELVTTPTGPTGVLASVTIATTFEAAEKAGMYATHRLMRVSEVVDSDGAWLVSSVRGIAPIRSLDGKEVPFDAEFHERLTELAGFPRVRAIQ